MTLKSVLIGFGRIGRQYADDAAMSRFYPYATHAQVLRDHQAFDWVGVVDPDEAALSSAREVWKVPHCAQSLSELEINRDEIEIAIFATNPGVRLQYLAELPNLKAVLVEKPLGSDLAEAQDFVSWCGERNILLQVNLWRRADFEFRALASGMLTERIGIPSNAQFYYGNGILNNGTHMIDFAQMLFGKVRHIQRIGQLEFKEGPLPDDTNFSFNMTFENEVEVAFIPLKFEFYRENGAVIWGHSGRLEIFNEGLTIKSYPRQQNRAMSGEYEVAADVLKIWPTTVGDALFEMYSNLASAVDFGRTSMLYCSGETALQTTKLLDGIITLPKSGCGLNVNF